MNQLIKFETYGGEVELSPQIVKDFLVKGQGNVTDQEVTLFMNLCKYQKLNPFLNEAYLIKFGTLPATIVTAFDAFKKRVSLEPRCKGWKAGIITEVDGESKYHVGAFAPKNEILVGGWSEVKREGWDDPIRVEVDLSEYQKFNGKGELQSNWANMPKTMIRKVAAVQAIREAFPEGFSNMFIEEENVPITRVSQAEVIEAEVVETVTKEDVMTMLTQASNFENGKDIEKGKKILHQALVELGLRELDVNYNELRLSTLTKDEYAKTVEKINEIKTRQ